MGLLGVTRTPFSSTSSWWWQTHWPRELMKFVSSSQERISLDFWKLLSETVRAFCTVRGKCNEFLVTVCRKSGVGGWGLNLRRFWKEPIVLVRTGGRWGRNRSFIRGRSRFLRVEWFFQLKSCIVRRSRVYFLTCERFGFLSNAIIFIAYLIGTLVLKP